MIMITIFECNKLCLTTFIYREISCQIEISQSMKSLIALLPPWRRPRAAKLYAVNFSFSTTRYCAHA